MVESIAKKLQEEGKDLRSASVDSLLKYQRELGLVSLWVQAADGLEDWQKKTEQVKETVIGDCEYEVSQPDPSERPTF
jgi:hypothetical protein